MVLCGLAMIAMHNLADGGAAVRIGAVATALAILVAQGMLSTAMGPFWGAHHKLVPPSITGISAAYIGIWGNAGGLFGPPFMGIIHDSLGPPCPAEHSPCMSEYGWSAVLEGVVELALTLWSASVMVRHDVLRMSAGDEASMV